MSGILTREESLREHARKEALYASMKPDETTFRAACAEFRRLCAEIGAFIGNDTFKGGFDEYAVFASSEAYASNPVLGNSYAIRWSAFNELCKYEGAKLGYGQPQWWYECWNEEN